MQGNDPGLAWPQARARQTGNCQTGNQKPADPGNGISGLGIILAEAVRFELTNGCPLPVFKTGAIDHSATLPALLQQLPERALAALQHFKRRDSSRLRRVPGKDSGAPPP